jgi:hypothetical protein
MLIPSGQFCHSESSRSKLKRIRFVQMVDTAAMYSGVDHLPVLTSADSLSL